MKIKKYQAKTLREVLEIVRSDMGPNAVILRTEDLKKKGVEVTAALDDTISTAKPAFPDPSAVNSDSPKTYSRKGTVGDLKKASISNGDVEELKSEIHKLRDAVEKPDKAVEDLRKEVRELRRRLEGQPLENAGEIPEEFKKVATELLQQGVSVPIVRDIVADLIMETDPDERSESVVREVCKKIIAIKFPAGGEIRKREGRATIVLLVGPTGVGKSTTIAKIAGKLILEGKEAPGILSTDAYRMGAMEQMSAFAEAAAIQFESVFAPDEIDDALERLSNKKLILVDSAGRSYIHQEHMDELSEIAKKVGADEVHLVLPANMDESGMEEVLKRFAPMGVNRLLFTKIDESVRKGCLLNVALSHGLPVSFMCDGQQIPDDLHIASGNSVASFILGESE